MTCSFIDHLSPFYVNPIASNRYFGADNDANQPCCQTIQSFAIVFYVSKFGHNESFVTVSIVKDMKTLVSQLGNVHRFGVKYCFSYISILSQDLRTLPISH